MSLGEKAGDAIKDHAVSRSPLGENRRRKDVSRAAGYVNNNERPGRGGLSK